MNKLLLCLLTLLPAAAPAQDTVAFRLTPAATTFALTQVFTVKVEAELPSKYSLAPDTASADTSQFDLLSFTRTGGGESGGRRTEVYEVKAQAFALGVSTFPQIAWTMTAQGEEPSRAKSPSFNLTVTPIFETQPGQEIRDIYPPLRFVPWLLIALALLALSACAWWLYKKFGPKDGLLPAPAAWADTRQPYQRARDRLDKLAACALPRAGKIKEFYIGVTSILRLYLAEEFAIDAAQMTTADLAKELKKTGTGVKTSLRTREFLQKADLVKFARLQPEDAEADTEALRELLAEYTRAADLARALPPLADRGVKAQQPPAGAGGRP